MKILERNYQNSIQSYLRHDNESEARESLRGNLLSRLFRFISRDLDEEEIKTTILPNVRIRVIKIENKLQPQLPIFMGGLSSPTLKFEGTKGEFPSDITSEFKTSGVELPTPEILNKKLDKMYSSNGTFLRDPFNMSNLKVTEILNSPISESDFSDYSSLEDTMYSEDSHTNHFKMVKAISLMALHKHVTENPNSPKERLISGINNLTKDLNDEIEKTDLTNYLLRYVNDKNSRFLLVKESELVIKQRSDSANNATSIPTWVVVSVVSLLLLGGLAYTQREKLANAWKFSREVKSKQPEVSKHKSFFKALFSSNGRSIAKDYLNDKSTNVRSKNFLDEVHILKKEAKAKVLRTDYNMELLMKKFLNK
jgi:hypothetical protein